MGFNTTVVVLNDALVDIERDPEFGRKLSQAVMSVRRGEPVDVPAMGHVNAATVIETHHADGTVLVSVGGNYGHVQAYSSGYSHHKPEDAERMCRDWADSLGFTLTRKRKAA